MSRSSCTDTGTGTMARPLTALIAGLSRTLRTGRCLTSWTRGTWPAWWGAWPCSGAPSIIWERERWADIWVRDEWWATWHIILTGIRLSQLWGCELIRGAWHLCTGQEGLIKRIVDLWWTRFKEAIFKTNIWLSVFVAPRLDGIFMRRASRPLLF